MAVATFTPSIYQRTIFEKYSRTNNNLVIRACPGSGKTTTMVKLCSYTKPGRKQAFMAFSKVIVEELKHRLPPTVDTQTFHSMGCRAIMRHWSGKVSIVEDKTFTFAIKMADKFERDIKQMKESEATNPFTGQAEKEEVKGWKNEGEKYKYCYIIQDIINFYRLSNCQTREQCEAVIDRQGIELIGPLHVDHAMDVWHDIKKYNFSDHFEGKKMIDFTDMIYLPSVMTNIRLQQYHEVMVDECQDMNVLQQMLLKRIIMPGGRFVAVGDVYQCIFSFMGSDAESFNKLIDWDDNTLLLPLSVSYRCAKSIVEKANTVFDVIEPFEGAIEGEVIETDSLEYLYESVVEDDFILCRNTQPLVEVYFELLQQERRCYIKGKDVGASIIKLIEKMDSFTVSSGIDMLKDLLPNLIETLEKRGVKKPMEHPSYEALYEKVRIIEMISKKYDSMFQVKQCLQTMFSDEKTNSIILSTIHKSKGLETKNVYLIRPDLIPSKYATQAWQIEQENNLLYVAYTRAKEKLIIVKNQ